jgi:hypothetical protein
MENRRSAMTRSDLFTLCTIAAICSACSPSPNASTGTGATGGTGTGGAAGCEAPAENVYDNTTETGLPACQHPVAPLPTEDGTFAVTVFGPFATPFQLDGFTFAATEGTDSSITDPWTAAVIVVPAGSDPLAVNPNDAAKPYPLTLLEELPTTVVEVTVNRYSIQLDAPLAVSVCDKVVVALRNTVGPPDTWIQQCGEGSDHPETNQWWNLDNTMTEMSTYRSNFDRDWWVSLLPAPGK